MKLPHERPLPSAAVEGLRAADLVDAMTQLHRHRCHILDLVSPTPDVVVYGPCVTISYFPTCDAVIDPERSNFGALYEEAMAGGAEGSVLVLASNGYRDTSLAGGTKLSRVARDGVAGVVADGRLRDFDQLAADGVSAWCRGEALRWGGETTTPFQANVPVVFDGVGVMPGDHIFADRSGAVAIPAAQVVEVLDRAHAVVERDNRYRDDIRIERRPSARIR